MTGPAPMKYPATHSKQTHAIKLAKRFTLTTLVVLMLAVPASAQPLATRSGPLAFGGDFPTQETGPWLPNALDAQRPLGFGPSASGSVSRPFTLVAADSRADGGGGSRTATPSAAPDQAAELAKKLQNPVASLISVPLQNNWDFGIGPRDAMRYTANIQPVLPFSLTKDWNLIARTIMPVIYAEAPVPGGDNTAGLGDITQSFFSPKEPTGGGWIWGVGPVFLYPTATDEALGGEKFGLGPTAVLLKQEKGWTYGMLATRTALFSGEVDVSKLTLPADNGPYRSGKGMLSEGGTGLPHFTNSGQEPSFFGMTWRSCSGAKTSPLLRAHYMRRSPTSRAHSVRTGSH